MTILFRYILREFSKIFGMCFAGLATIYLVIDFFEKVRRFLRYESGILPILAYFALKVPSISFQVAPFAILVSTLLTLGLLARSNEITAMRSCGISLLWMSSPFFSSPAPSHWFSSPSVRPLSRLLRRRPKKFE